MNKSTQVSSIMTKKVITLSSGDRLEKAELLFKTKNIRHIPVVKDSAIIGMLSYSDLLRISFADAIDEDEEYVDAIVYEMFTIEQVMTRNLVSVSPVTTLKAEILSKREFHALPVVIENKLVGIVTTTDLINFMLEQFN
jgi:CBS domain-containing membrane protein